MQQPCNVAYKRLKTLALFGKMVCRTVVLAGSGLEGLDFSGFAPSNVL